MAGPDLRGGFELPFAEQLDFFRQKLNLPTQRWDDIWQAAHDRSFVVAGAMKADLLNDLRQAVEKAIANGTTLETFRKDFKRIVAERGWTGWTGEGSKAGEAWRTRVIYETNLRSSHAAGRYAQLTDPELLKRRPYWRYVHSDSVLNPRPHHKAWGDAKLTLRHDHPFWKTHCPPNGWGCRCRVTSVAAPKTGDGTEPPEGWDELDGKGQLPGIDKGWAYAPGRSLVDELRGVVEAKVEKLPAQLGDALKKDAAQVLSPAFAQAKTAKEAAELAVKHQLADFADYTGVKPEVANAWNQSLFDHIREFPELRKNQAFAGSAQGQFKRYAEVARARYVATLISKGMARELATELAEKKIKVPKVKGTTYAQSWTQPEAKGVAVNAKFGGAPELFKESLARDVATQWHPIGCDTIRSVVDHELGHQLDALMELRLDSEVISAYKEAKLKGINDEVSGYAGTNIAEFIAECWAESCNNPNPRHAARTVAAIVRARYRSRFNSGAGN